MEEKLKEIYYNPLTGLISANKLYQKVKKDGISLKQCQEFIRKQETGQLYKPITKEKAYFPITSYEPYEHLQVDLLDLSNIATTNSHYKYLLVAIDVFTRKALAIPLKFKNADLVVFGMRTVIELFKPKIITTDNGKEYINKELQNLLKEHNIEHRFIDVNQHATLGIVDRFCRTLRGLINKFCTSHKTTRYIDALDKLVNNYNNTYHSTIKCTPNEAKSQVEQINTIMIKKYATAKEKETTFSIGDKVRHLENISIFEKQGLSKWSKNIFTIVDKKPHSYLLTNGKWYRYYQLLLANETQEIKKVGRPTKHTMQTIRKENSVKRKLRQEDIDLKNVVNAKRPRQQTDRFSY